MRLPDDEPSTPDLDEVISLERRRVHAWAVLSVLGLMAIGVVLCLLGYGQ